MKALSCVAVLIVSLMCSLPLLASDLATKIVGTWKGRNEFKGGGTGDFTMIFTKSGTYILRIVTDGDGCVLQQTYRLTENDHLVVVLRQIDGEGCSATAGIDGKEHDNGLVELLSDNEILIQGRTLKRQ